MTEREANREIRAIRKAARRIIASGQARDFLIRRGFITKGGKLTARYGGAGRQ